MAENACPLCAWITSRESIDLEQVMIAAVTTADSASPSISRDMLHRIETTLLGFDGSWLVLLVGIVTVAVIARYLFNSSFAWTE